MIDPPAPKQATEDLRYIHLPAKHGRVEDRGDLSPYTFSCYVKQRVPFNDSSSSYPDLSFLIGLAKFYLLDITLSISA